MRGEQKMNVSKQEFDTYKLEAGSSIERLHVDVKTLHADIKALHADMKSSYDSMMNFMINFQLTLTRDSRHSKLRLTVSKSD
jgi:uncharacterized protein (UPF0335 family)